MVVELAQLQYKTYSCLYLNKTKIITDFDYKFAVFTSSVVYRRSLSFFFCQLHYLSFCDLQLLWYLNVLLMCAVIFSDLSISANSVWIIHGIIIYARLFRSSLVIVSMTSNSFNKLIVGQKNNHTYAIGLSSLKRSRVNEAITIFNGNDHQNTWRNISGFRPRLVN